MQSRLVKWWHECVSVRWIANPPLTSSSAEFPKALFAKHGLENKKGWPTLRYKAPWLLFLFWLFHANLAYAVDYDIQPQGFFYAFSQKDDSRSPDFVTAPDAFAWAQATLVDYHPYGATYSLSNLRPIPSYGFPYDITLNGVYAYQFWDMTVCTGSCSLLSAVDHLYYFLTCPQDFGLVATNLPFQDGNRLYVCRKPVYFYLRAAPLSQAQCQSCNENSVGHPINPASGAMFDTISDASSTAGSLPFKRFYNSIDTGSADLSGSWRHSYSRNVLTKYSSIVTRQYITAPDTSSQYPDPASACTSGFVDIALRVANWSGATAVYSNGSCVLTKNNVPIGWVTIYATAPADLPRPDPIAYDVMRDDGQLIRFTVLGGAIIPPPSISLQLKNIATGFTITDNNDNVETYDAKGKLLSITHRGGVVQTMSYDVSGRLSGVSDSFGHQLILSYDAQGRLSTVTRQ